MSPFNDYYVATVANCNIGLLRNYHYTTVYLEIAKRALEKFFCNIIIVFILLLNN